MSFDDLSPEACYRAMTAHDARFDGHFYVGVRSTRVYCRPVCRVRLPKPQNCTFHASAAAAESAGFRPCLRCRPELAPGVAAAEGSRTLARTAARMIESGAAGSGGLPALAGRIGVTGRHLRRIFAAEFGVSPVQFAQTHRLLLAKRLLTDTSLPVAGIAGASGFSSVRRMNTLFTERYGFAPTTLRRPGHDRAEPGADAIELLLTYRPPYDFAGLLRFLGARAIPGVEAAGSDGYRRVVRLEQGTGAGRVGWLELTHAPQRDALKLRVDARLAGATQALLARARQAFDLCADPSVIDATLGPLALGAPGLRLPGAFDPFELALRAILGQQVSVRAARTLAQRFVQAFGAPVATPFADLTRAFPPPRRVARLGAADIGALGIVGQRAQAMIALAQAIDAGVLDLSATADPQQAIAGLRALRGIGPWTAHYIAMRALAWPDAWLRGDVALQAALGLPNTAAGHRAAEARAASWQPWRSYAVLHLWRGLEAAHRRQGPP